MVFNCMYPNTNSPTKSSWPDEVEEELARVASVHHIIIVARSGVTFDTNERFSARILSHFNGSQKVYYRGNLPTVFHDKDQITICGSAKPWLPCQLKRRATHGRYGEKHLAIQVWVPRIEKGDYLR
jgi:hypothetical protein